jgi:hypothetical protein
MRSNNYDPILKGINSKQKYFGGLQQYDLDPAIVRIIDIQC